MMQLFRAEEPRLLYHGHALNSGGEINRMEICKLLLNKSRPVVDYHRPASIILSIKPLAFL
jgi:hypothetical protein